MKEADLRAYVDRLLRLQDEGQEELDEASLREIARELGLDDEAWEALERLVQEQLQRGLGYLDHDLADDALRELEEAASMAPGRFDVLAARAAAHGLRWRQKGSEGDREAARRLARRCLERDPSHEPSFTLLAGLNARRATPLWPLVILGLVLVTPIVATFLNRPKAPPIDGTATAGEASTKLAVATPMPEPPTRTVAEASPPLVVEASSPPLATPGELPIRWIPGASCGDMAFRARRSRVAHGYYSLHGELRLQGKRSVGQLRLRLDLLDEQGRGMASDDFDALATHQARRRPGDWIVFDHLLKAEAKVSRARLAPILVDALPSEGPYSPSPIIPVSWRLPKPPTSDLAFRARRNEFSPSTFGKQVGYHHLTVEVENRSKSAVSKLKLALTVFDGEGGVLASKPMYGALGSGPAILPGETRIVSTISSLQKAFGRFELAVVAIE